VAGGSAKIKCAILYEISITTGEIEDMATVRQTQKPEQYPKMHRNCTARLRDLLKRVPGLEPKEREDLAMAINNLADKAHDLNEIFEQLLQARHKPGELADLFIAFELTTEQIRVASDIIDGRLYEVGDRLKKLESEEKD
jgi:hypothetical protein